MGGVPPKLGLGRGLGTLLRDAQRTSAGSAPIGKTDSEGPAVSPGMATLLRGANGKSQPAPSTPPTETRREASVIRAALVLADVLLCGVVAWLAFFGPRPWGAIEALLCIFAIVTGAWLAYLAFTMKSG